MIFSDVAQTIIDNSIRTAICIDDEVIEPFEKTLNLAELEFTQNLYQSFRNNDSTLDFFRFGKKMKWQDHKPLLFDRKDLLILDWQLEKSPPQYKSALELLDDAIHTDNLHFVCIYTAEPENTFQDIIYAILAYFSGNEKQKAQKALSQIFETLEDAGYDPNELFEGLKLTFKEMALRPKQKGAKYGELRNKIKEHLGKDDFNDFEEKLKEAFSNGKNDAKIICENFGYVLNESEVYKEEPLETPIDIKPFVNENFVILNHTIVLIINKKAVNPADLYVGFRDAIINSSQNFLPLMGLEMRNLFLESSAFIGKDLDSVSELAFFHHMESLDSKEAFYDFLKELWKDQAASFLYDESKQPHIFQTFDEYKTSNKIDSQIKSEISKPSFHKGLAKLNYYYNTLIVNRNGLINFGDVFSIEEEKNQYLLCITALCDCVHPEKIQHLFFFVKGSKYDIKKGLEEGDTGFNSFIRNEKNEIDCIKWKDKPFTVYIPIDNNDVEKEIVVSVGSKNLKLKYHSTLKENYAQRIANNAFTYPLRVGILYADLKNKE